MHNLSTFSKRAIQLIKAIPEGKVATYGLIAALAGNPRAARGVTWLLHSSSEKYTLPWHRVINAKGQISFSPLSSSYSLQKELLEQEGIIIINGHIDLKKYLWDVDSFSEYNQNLSSTNSG